nr:hypothetical protein [Serratia sp. FDAARGOS_506]
MRKIMLCFFLASPVSYATTSALPNDAVATPAPVKKVARHFRIFIGKAKIIKRILISVAHCAPIIAMKIGTAAIIGILHIYALTPFASMPPAR